MLIIQGNVQPDSIVYKDNFIMGYDVLDIAEFKHCRISHTERFAQERNG